MRIVRIILKVILIVLLLSLLAALIIKFNDFKNNLNGTTIFNGFVNVANNLGSKIYNYLF
jgi:ABC-type antimicrobial peptide transport system permease subunit